MSDQRPELLTLVLPSDAAPLQLDGAALELFETDVLPAFLPQQRWFADKDAALGRVGIIDRIALDGEPPVELAVVELARSQRLYFVPFAFAPDQRGTANASGTLARVRHGAHDGLLIDGFATDALPLALLDDVRHGRRRPSDHGAETVAHATPALAELKLPPTLTVRRLSVEQSNTSVIVGDAVMIKGYRRVHRGPQPELEIARFLDTVGYANTPTLLGFVEYEQPGQAPIALCILQRFVVSQGDGWAATLEYLGAFFARPAAGEGAAQTDEHDRFMHGARMLGRRTAELHRAFATPTGDAAFEPEPTTDEDLAAWIEQARATAETALATLERGRDRVPAELRPTTDALLERRQEIMDRLAVPSLGAAHVLKTRYHGDYHLGQVLAVADDFMIVDFEGEPGREAAVRRRKSSPLRDVAGMLRSINYAAVAGLRGVTAERGEDNRALESRARDWEARSVAAFLDGYRTTIAGCASYPANPRQAQRLLDLFVLEKAFYEMSYELANRPSWLQIPLEGICAILDAGEYAIATS